MKHISDLFKRYQNNLIPPQSSVVKEFISVCDDLYKYSIKEEYVEYTPGTKTLYIKAPSVLKSELVRKKSEILQELTQRLGKHAPSEMI